MFFNVRLTISNMYRKKTNVSLKHTNKRNDKKQNRNYDFENKKKSKENQQNQNLTLWKDLLCSWFERLNIIKMSILPNFIDISIQFHSKSQRTLLLILTDWDIFIDVLGFTWWTLHEMYLYGSQQRCQFLAFPYIYKLTYI